MSDEYPLEVHFDGRVIAVRLADNTPAMFSGALRAVADMVDYDAKRQEREAIVARFSGSNV